MATHMAAAFQDIAMAATLQDMAVATLKRRALKANGDE